MRAFKFIFFVFSILHCFISCNKTVDYAYNTDYVFVNNIPLPIEISIEGGFISEDHFTIPAHDDYKIYVTGSEGPIAPAFIKVTAIIGENEPVSCTHNMKTSFPNPCHEESYERSTSNHGRNVKYTYTFTPDWLALDETF